MTDTNVSNQSSEFSELQSFDDVISSGATISKATDYIGDGWTVCSDKDQLVNVPFFVLKMHEHKDAKTGRAYWSLRIITKQNDRLILNDGGQGIPSQCKTMLEAGLPMPAYFRGLRASHYVHPEHGDSVTYYFDV